MVNVKDGKVDMDAFDQICKEIGQACNQEQITAALEEITAETSKGYYIPTHLWVICLAAYRSVEWLGLGEYISPFCIYAFCGGPLNP
jgi:hypothetical protein